MDTNLEHEKLVMENLNIPYINTLYMSNNMMCKVVPNSLAPYQTTRFLVEFNIKDISIWFDLTFDQAEQLLTNMENTRTNTSNSNTGNTPKPKASSSTLALIGEKINIPHK
jgi:hypothetical protein